MISLQPNKCYSDYIWEEVNFVKMDNLDTKPSSCYDSLVARLVILTNMRNKPYLSAARYVLFYVL